MATREEKERIAQIRQRHEEASTNWQLGSGGLELYAVSFDRRRQRRSSSCSTTADIPIATS